MKKLYILLFQQALSIWAFGANEFALRLPSALAALLTCFAVFYFAKRHLDPLIGIVAVLFLVTTQGYIRIHVTRSGDLDSVLVLFVTLYSLLFFDYLMQDAKTHKSYFVGLGAFVFCAFLTKSVAGLMPILGLFLGAVFIGQTKEILTNKWVYLTAFLTLLLCASFYMIRENASRGYWEVVLFSEYRRFANNIMPWHEQPFWFYLTNMSERFYTYYLPFLPFTILGLFSKNINIKRFTQLGITFSLSYFCLISYPMVKLEWYDAPLYPILSLLLATALFQGVQYFCSLPSQKGGINFLISGFARNQNTFSPNGVSENLFVKVVQNRPNNLMENLILGIVSCAIFYIPYSKIYQQNKLFLPTDTLELDGFAIRELSKTSPEIKHYKVLLPVKHIEHIDQVNFYIKSLNHFKGYNIKLINDTQSVENNDIILCSQLDSIEKIKKRFKIEEICTIHKSKLMRVK